MSSTLFHVEHISNLCGHLAGGERLRGCVVYVPTCEHMGFRGGGALCFPSVIW